VAIEPTDDSPLVPPRELYKPAVAHVPTAEELAAIAGTYRSAELDTTYIFAVKDGILTGWSLRRTDPLKWTPSIRDRFDSDDMWGLGMEVARGADGAVAAVLLEMGRSRKVRFDRVAG
jgi:hypothetical protein